LKVMPLGLFSGLARKVFRSWSVDTCHRADETGWIFLCPVCYVLKVLKMASSKDKKNQPCWCSRLDTFIDWILDQESMASYHPIYLSTYLSIYRSNLSSIYPSIISIIYLSPMMEGRIGIQFQKNSRPTDTSWKST
jgi:hypothetical protein